ncbi:hypothetical protein FHG64_13220 [Antarcticibacterium flavum]|uniref:NIPSNAP domain-containing protein n=1 Tax=Antarcticibacterium flavum TaxID=2058175 RepID=A0A5B7X4G3_9FLAO|nr:MULTISPECIES: hypothetical protein [Antarcticibacterium]MCM4158541.1 hypothetical protein [Antarcticibacterium sp. W02-3]QCY70287.1 hypothetical protein FHG64_13220 [Antarcticibacterium flavum]
MKIAHLTLMVFALLGCNNLLAQTIENDPIDKADLYQIEYYQFNADKAEEARMIIDNYFSVAHQLAGVPHPVMQLQLTSDDYNYMAVWKLPVGIDHLNWQSSPANPRWYNAFVTVAGSEEKAKEIIEKYDSYIRDSKTEFARKPH